MPWPIFFLFFFKKVVLVLGKAGNSNLTLYFRSLFDCVVFMYSAHFVVYNFHFIYKFMAILSDECRTSCAVLSKLVSYKMSSHTSC